MLIEAKELRVGNLVFENTYNMSNGNYEGVPVVANGNIIKTIELSPTLHAYSPIPLSPDILLKCGFEKRDNGISIDYHIGINEITKDWLFYIVWIDGFQYPFYKNGRHEIKYLHQLQNLYHSLTGSELNINF